MKSDGNNQERRTVNLVLQNGSGYEWLSGRLSDDRRSTHLRFLPLPDSEGGFNTVLMPHVNEDAVEATDILGDSFYRTQVYNMFINGTFYEIPKSCTYIDNKGDVVNAADSPIGRLVYRIRWKTWVTHLLKLPVDYPYRWDNLTGRGEGKNGRKPYAALNRPFWKVLFQCMYSMLDGKMARDSEGKAIYRGPAVFQLSDLQANALAKSLVDREDPSSPISLTNTKAFDFWSWDKGVVLSWSKSTSKSDSKGTSEFSGKTTYSLSPIKTVVPLDPSKILPAMKAWEDVLHTPGVEESIALLLDLFDPQAVDYALRGTAYEAYLPDSVKGASANISEVPVQDRKTKEWRNPNPKVPIPGFDGVKSESEPKEKSSKTVSIPTVSSAVKPTAPAVDTPPIPQKPSQMQVQKSASPVQSIEVTENGEDGGEEDNTVPSEVAMPKTDADRMRANLEALTRRLGGALPSAPTVAQPKVSPPALE